MVNLVYPTGPDIRISLKFDEHDIDDSDLIYVGKYSDLMFVKNSNKVPKGYTLKETHKYGAISEIWYSYESPHELDLYIHNSGKIIAVYREPDSVYEDKQKKSKFTTKGEEVEA